MILVTLGTQKQQFTRLLDYIENSNIADKIIVQAGHTMYSSKKMTILDFVNHEKMDKLIEEADVVITHGGTGSIISALKKGKKIIACARKKQYGEHIDDHQLEIVELFAEKGYVLELNELTNLDEILEKIAFFRPNVYEESTGMFKEKLTEEIDKYLK